MDSTSKRTSPARRPRSKGSSPAVRDQVMAGLSVGFLSGGRDDHMDRTDHARRCPVRPRRGAVLRELSLVVWPALTGAGVHRVTARTRVEDEFATHLAERRAEQHARSQAFLAAYPPADVAVGRSRPIRRRPPRRPALVRRPSRRRSGKATASSSQHPSHRRTRPSSSRPPRTRAPELDARPHPSRSPRLTAVPRSSTTTTWQWQQRRQWWATQLAAGAVIACPRCGRPVTAEMQWDLDHFADDDLDEHTVPAHRRCNRQAGSTRGNARQRELIALGRQHERERDGQPGFLRRPRHTAPDLSPSLPPKGTLPA